MDGGAPETTITQAKPSMEEVREKFYAALHEARENGFDGLARCETRYPEVDPNDDGEFARMIRAAAKFGQSPGPVDVTRCHIGNRYGFFVSVGLDNHAPLEITVRSPLLAREVTFQSGGKGPRASARTEPGEPSMSPQEVGASEGMIGSGSVIRW